LCAKGQKRLTPCRQAQQELKTMTAEQRFVDHLYQKYEGRVAIGVGYDHNLSEIYPFVFEDSDDHSIGAVALGVIQAENLEHVYIYHLSSFKSKRGSGKKMLAELCRQADKFQVVLSLSPLFVPNGKNEHMSSERLKIWYGKFGFKGSPQFKREPGIK
jgi:hypothetical protein